MRKLGVAVVGVGFWGRNHVRIFNEMEEAELVAVCDVDAGRASEVAERYGVEAYTNSDDLLRREDVEAVSICTWSTVLAREAEKALRAGKHVLVEKPMANRFEEARLLVDLAEKDDLVLAVGFVERFNPGVRRVKELLDAGRIGDVLVISSKRLSRWPRRPWDVGVVKDLAIHDLDLIRYLLGTDPETLYALVWRKMRSDLDDHAIIVLSFPGGEVGLIEANWLTAYKVRSLRATGTEGVLSLDYLKQEIIVEDPSGRSRLTSEWREPLKLELEHFVDCVLRGRRPLVSGEDGLRALGLCEAALISASRGEPVRVRDLLEGL